MFICIQKINFIPSFFFEILQRYYKLVFLGTVGWPVKTILPACRKLWCLSSCKNHIYPSPLSWNITKILQTCYFEYFGHASPCPPKAIAPTLEILMVICKQKINLIPRFFSAIWLVKNSWAITPWQEFCQTWGLRWKVKN